MPAASVRSDRRQGREGDDVDRDGQKADAEALQEADADHGPFRDVGRPGRHLIKRIGAGGEADADQQARADLADQPPAQQRGEHQSGASRRQHDTGGDHGIVHQRLQIGRQQCQGRIHDQPHGEIQGDPDDEIPIGKQPWRKERPWRQGKLDKKQVEANPGQAGLHDDFVGSRTSPAFRRGRAWSETRRSRD